MFDELRKKISNAVRSFIKTEKEEVKAEEQEIKAEAPEIKAEPPEHVTKPEPAKTKGGALKLTLKTKIKSVFSGTVKLSDADIDKFIDSMRTSMLQSDVSYSTTEDFLDDLRTQLKSQEVSSRDISGEVTGMVRGSLLSVLQSTKPFDMMQFVKARISSGEKPVKILFLGPNGTGKTTTIAKLAHTFKKNGVSTVLSASDTFRAAAIEQLALHAERIGVPIIKSTYGADPASVAFDAIAYAGAHGLDSVLIDSAGRQETNRSLVEEMRKIARISKPDLIVFVGESTAGNVIAEQVKEFGRFMDINGIILTKLDADAKGGGAISIAHTTGKPVLFFGTGEGYDKLVPYSPEFVVDTILPAS